VGEFDLHLSAGRIHARSYGPDDGELVLCVHGLSANHHGFDAIAPAIAALGRRVVAVDLRGRGASETTAPGTYGLQTHTTDVLEAASALEAERFDFIGWSMGALIGLAAVRRAPDRIRTLGLIDAVGPMDEAAVEQVIAGLERLDAVVPTVEAYVEAMRAADFATPWGPLWEAYFAYELGPAPDGGLTPRTSKTACLEDIQKFQSLEFEPLWSAVAMPVTLVRCTVALGGGDVVPAATRDAFRAAVPRAEVVEVDRNHYGVIDAPETIAALQRLVDSREAPA
jgi:pimeloyl-ACP methyl ester carboxylesterase